MSIYEKLRHIQLGLKAPKSQYNEFGNFFYRNCEDILFAVKPLLEEENCTIVISDELLLVGERYYISATVELIDCETGERVSNRSYAREEHSIKGMASSQITGSASTYARKYALNGLLCIDDSRDPDSADDKSDADKPAGITQDKEELLKEFKREIKRTGKSYKYFLKEAAANAIEELSEDFLNNAIVMLGKCPDKKKGDA